ncbi:MAG: hypothetical protein ACE5KY_06685, partial [Candidatus Tectimicrobiota bacterium]
MVRRSSRMVGEDVPRPRGFLFLATGLLFSLALHGAVLGPMFYPRRPPSAEEGVEAAPPLTVADRLAAADSAILEGGASVLERVKRKRQEMFAI